MQPHHRFAGVVIPLVLAAGFACIGGGCRRPSGDDRVVILIGDRRVTAGEFRQAMAARGGEIPQVFAKAENRLALADELIRSEVLAIKAEQDGLLDDPAIRAQLRQLLVDHFERHLLEKAGPEWRPSSNEVMLAYGREKARYAVPAASRAAVVFVSASGASPEKKAALRARAEQARAEALALPASVPHFGPVAARYSDDQATRYQGGDGGWDRPDRESFRWPGLEAALAGLVSTGQVSELIETDSGFFLMKLMERRAASVLPFETVRRNIERDLILRKKKEILGRAYEEAARDIRIVVDESAIRDLPAPAAKAAAPPTNPSDD
jgi:parvulin-like peptidyl-prolyl isomerase